MYVFTPKRGTPICHVLLTDCSKHASPALLFIDNREFIGFLHKQNGGTTDINLLSLIGP